MYVSALQADDGYATLDWDDFVYYPRAIAVAERWAPPIDPWVYHEQSLPTWGAIPPIPASAFGLLLRATGDIHTSLYVASVLATLLIGSMIMMLLRSRPFDLAPSSALLGAIVFVKMPWLAVKAQQLVPPWRFVRETISPFVLGRPLDALTTVEAGLFTYAFYVLFLVCFWRAAYRRNARAFVVAGAAAGVLVYVYFYHYIYAFALIASWIVVAVVRRRWRDARHAALCLAAGLICTVPHFVNLARGASAFDAVEYFSRLGVEPGRFVFGNLRYFAALIIPLGLAAVYVRRAAPSERRETTLLLMAAMVLAYAGAQNLRVVLGFDVQSDHYWRQSLALPATLWVIFVCAELLRGVSGIAKPALAAIIGIGFVFSNGSWLSARTHPEPPSPAQSLMAERMALLVNVAERGDVVLVPDVTTAYHASVNARVRPFVPFVHALVSRAEIVRRYFLGQCLTGTTPFRMPGRTPLPTLDETAVLRSEQKYLLGTDAAVLADDVMEAMRTAAAACETGSGLDIPRLDVVLVPTNQQPLARERISRHFDIIREASAAGYWAARVRPRAVRP